MRRALLLLLGIAAITWLEFEIFPGHTYLQGDTQILLPILERLDSPGYLSRDLVATHPHVTYTIYDEATLFLHEAARLDFQTALTAQQLVCRAAAILGVFLLALAAGVQDTYALLIAAFVNLGATLAGPAVPVTDPEATPRAFAFGLVLLAMGLLAKEKPLLAGLMAGLALVYHVPTAAPFWGVALLAFIFERRLRTLLRPALSILIVFALLLANLAQLQPGVVEPQPLFAKISTRLAALQQFRTSYVWVSLWAGREIWQYLAIWICGLWATARIWPRLNLQLRWFLVALPLCGVLSVPLSDLLLEHLRWSAVAQLQPARTLVFTVAMSSLACAVAGVRAALLRRAWEAGLWCIVVFALPINVRLLDLLRLLPARHAMEFALSIVFAFGLALLLRQSAAWTRTRKPVLLLALVAAVFALQAVSGVPTGRNGNDAALSQLANWAESNTWGSSMFLFPDAGRELYPGIFRAWSRRALWVDWKSGTQMKYFESAGEEWWQRWRQTMQPAFSAPRLEAMLSLPIDYYVLKRAHRLANARPVFQNQEFVVYDATDLASAGPLRTLESR